MRKVEYCIEVTGVTRTKIRKPIKYIVNENGCWICISHCRDNKGYPLIGMNYKTLKLSRYMYTRFIKEIPEGLCILHSCDNPNCINPNHLRTGTPLENINDRQIRNRQSHNTGRKGELHSVIKLNLKKVLEIRNDNRSCTLIAKIYGVSSQTISSIRRNEIWKI